MEKEMHLCQLCIANLCIADSIAKGSAMGQFSKDC